MGERSPFATLQRAVAVIERGDILSGLAMLEADQSLRQIPVANSYLAYCIAKARGQCREAIALCEAALSLEPRNPAHYLNLGRIFLVGKRKSEAFAAFREGLNAAAADGASAASPLEDPAAQRALLQKELRRMGNRRRLPFPSLPRQHSLNRVVGKALARLNLP